MSTQGSEDSVPISEKVRFWEEQDKINQELIPRVIRQHELLTRHIGEHESLPEVVANAVQNAVTAVREDQKREFDAEVANITAGIGQLVEVAVDQAKAESERRARQTRSLVIGLSAASAAVGVAAMVLSVLALLGR